MDSKLCESGIPGDFLASLVTTGARGYLWIGEGMVM